MTNGNNIVNWADRNLPSFAVQTIGKTTVIPLAHFVDASSTGSSSFLSSNWLAKVTTSTPHGLVRGQTVSITTTNQPAAALMLLPSGSVYNRSLDNIANVLADPIDQYSFYIDYRYNFIII